NKRHGEGDAGSRMVHPEPNRALLFSTSAGNTVIGVRSGWPLSHETLWLGHGASSSRNPNVGHHGQSSKTWYGQDPLDGQPSVSRSDGVLWLFVGRHAGAGKVVDRCGGLGDVSGARPGRIDGPSWGHGGGGRAARERSPGGSYLCLSTLHRRGAARH